MTILLAIISSMAFNAHGGVDASLCCSPSKLFESLLITTPWLYLFSSCLGTTVESVSPPLFPLCMTILLAIISSMAFTAHGGVDVSLCCSPSKLFESLLIITPWLYLFANAVNAVDLFSSSRFNAFISSFWFWSVSFNLCNSFSKILSWCCLSFELSSFFNFSISSFCFFCTSLSVSSIVVSCCVVSAESVV